jgi:hypothetical protein
MNHALRHSMPRIERLSIIPSLWIGLTPTVEPDPVPFFFKAPCMPSALIDAPVLGSASLQSERFTRREACIGPKLDRRRTRGHAMAASPLRRFRSTLTLHFGSGMLSEVVRDYPDAGHAKMLLSFSFGAQPVGTMPWN